MIYFDNAATTPLKKEVLDAMLPFYGERFANPSSIYKAATGVRLCVEEARGSVALAIGADTNEIYFTSGGTEADNWALKGVAGTMRGKGKTHIITTGIEHHANMHTAATLKKEGFDITFLPVDEFGVVKEETLSAAITDKTGLCSIIMANNEVGTIQDIKALASICKQKGVLFHTDAVQAVGSISVDVRELGVDMLSLSAHKFGGPKGIGALYIKKGTKINNLLCGGAQEQNKRAGTENVAGIVGLGVAITIAVQNLKQNADYLKKLRDDFQDKLHNTIPKIRINGAQNSRLPGNLSVSFEGIEGEGILLMLDMKDIAASSGSACASGSLDPSHVLMALGLSHGIAQGTVRFSLSALNTQSEVDTVADELVKIVTRLREMSPVWEG